MTRRKPNRKSHRTQKAEPTKERTLLVTWTNEPVQPVRLYYSIPSRSFVTGRLRKLDCMEEALLERCWRWLYKAESASLRFQAGYDEVPEAKRPLILGRFRFPKGGGMTFQTNSIQRAIEGARFFAPHLGPKVVAQRCRVVNRCFAASEGSLKKLMKTLDQNVTMIDPRKAEEALEHELEAVSPNQDPERVAAELLYRRIDRREDVPVVEDFPLHPEEETEDFQHLTTTLELRFIRAVEHWRGNTNVTLTEIIMRTVEANMRAPALMGHRK